MRRTCVVAVLFPLLAACGSGAVAGTASPASGASAAAPATVGPATADPATADPATADPSASGPAATAGGSFCDAARADITSATGLASTLTPGSTKIDIKALAEKARPLNDALVAAAPPEIRADVEKLAAATAARLDALERTDGDVLAIAKDPAFLAAVQDGLASGRRLDSYLKTHCGFDTRSLLTGG